MTSLLPRDDGCHIYKIPDLVIDEDSAPFEIKEGRLFYGDLDVLKDFGHDLFYTIEYTTAINKLRRQQTQHVLELLASDGSGEGGALPSLMEPPRRYDMVAFTMLTPPTSASLRWEDAYAIFVPTESGRSLTLTPMEIVDDETTPFSMPKEVYVLLQRDGAYYPRDYFTNFHCEDADDPIGQVDFNLNIQCYRDQLGRNMLGRGSAPGLMGIESWFEDQHDPLGTSRYLVTVESLEAEVMCYQEPILGIEPEWDEDWTVEEMMNCWYHPAPRLVIPCSATLSDIERREFSHPPSSWTPLNCLSLKLDPDPLIVEVG